MILESENEELSNHKIKITFDKPKAMFKMTLVSPEGNYITEFKASLFALIEMAEQNGANIRARQ